MIDSIYLFEENIIHIFKEMLLFYYSYKNLLQIKYK